MMLESTSDDCRSAPDSNEPNPQVFLVDDHQIELDLMQRWCERGGYHTLTFDRPEELLVSLPEDPFGCVVADLQMPKLTGLELQRELRERGFLLPVILVTGHGDAENCRTAFKQGAFDFIEKGFDAVHLLETIGRAIHRNRRDRFHSQIRRNARRLLETVSPREQEVMRLLSSGMSLKGIAQELGISVQTVSKHRGSIFSKLRIDNEVDLYKTVLAADLDLDQIAASLPQPAGPSAIEL